VDSLTVKDNIIAVNGNSSTLNAAEIAGVISITGETGTYLLTNQYKINV
jgi:hypothetical protein